MPLNSVQVVHDHACRHVVGTPLPVRGDHAEVQLEGVGKRSDPLGASSILGHDNGFFPVVDVVANPFGNQGLGVEIVDGALEESLHLRGVQVDSYYVFDPGHVEQSSQQPGSDGPAM